MTGICIIEYEEIEGMEFEINGKKWKILEKSQEELCEAFNEEITNDKYFGMTIPEKQEIYLWKEVVIEQKKKTLYHELMHCYLYSYISFNNINFSIDDFCDISANSHDIIHRIVEEYFNK